MYAGVLVDGDIPIAVKCINVLVAKENLQAALQRHIAEVRLGRMLGDREDGAFVRVYGASWWEPACEGQNMWRVRLNLVMERMRTTLSKYLAEQGEGSGRPLPHLLRRDICLALCAAGKMLDRCRVMHCDLKADNILVFGGEDLNAKSNLRIKVSDFGFAVLYSDACQDVGNGYSLTNLPVAYRNVTKHAITPWNPAYPFYHPMRFFRNAGAAVDQFGLIYLMVRVFLGKHSAVFRDFATTGKLSERRISAPYALVGTFLSVAALVLNREIGVVELDYDSLHAFLQCI